MLDQKIYENGQKQVAYLFIQSTLTYNIDLVRCLQLSFRIIRTILGVFRDNTSLTVFGELLTSLELCGETGTYGCRIGVVAVELNRNGYIYHGFNYLTKRYSMCNIATSHTLPKKNNVEIFLFSIMVKVGTKLC